MKQSVFLKNIEKYYQKLTARLEHNDTAQAWRILALKNALESGPPHSKLPTWKYSNLQKILDTSFSMKIGIISQNRQNKIQEIAFKNEDDVVMVIVNGRYNEQLSNIPPSINVTISSLAALEVTHPKLFNELLKKSCQVTQFFQQLNAALAQDGAYIHISDDCDIPTPIRIYHFYINEAHTPIMLNTQTHIILGNNAKAHILEKSMMLGNLSLVNAQTFITCQKKAQLHFYRLSDNVENNYHFSHLITSQSQESVLNVIDVVLGGTYHRNETHYELTASLAKIDSSTLILPKMNQHYDCVSYATHLTKDCQSSQLIKSIVENHAHSSFQGIILVKEEAQKTVATMKNDNLFLGKKGRIDTVPQLEILTDDVQCRHGASISSLDDSSLFYLLSRGLNEEESKKMLIFAFIEEILAPLPSRLKDEINEIIHKHVQSMIAASSS